MVEPPDRAELQHPVADHRDQVPALPHECARQGAVVFLVVVGHLLGAVGVGQHLRRGGDHHLQAIG